MLNLRLVLLLSLVLPVAGCRSKAVDSAAEAEVAYLGFDAGVSRAIDLGLAGFAAASSANIDAQQGAGDVSGTMVVTGQVDQGSSDNKGLRLEVALDTYADVLDLDVDGAEDVRITYGTEDGAPLDLDVQLRDSPDGTLSGTLVGVAYLDGDLAGPAGFDLALEGTIEDDGTGAPQRVAGGTHVTGTVTGPSGGVWVVDVER